MQHNLRLVLFVINRYFSDFANSPRFQDLCQAGVKGLITSIDRFEPNRRFRLSTYSLFWIRHAIIRSMTLASFSRVPFGLESVCILLLTTHADYCFSFSSICFNCFMRNAMSRENCLRQHHDDVKITAVGIIYSYLIHLYVL